MNAPLPLNLCSNTNYEISPHPDHPRLLHLRLNPQALRGFLDNIRHIDVQNLEYVPFMRFHLAKTLLAHMGEEFAATLQRIVKDRKHGGFTLGLENTSNNSEDFVKFGTAIGHLLGPGNHDSMSGTYYARFLVKHTDASDSYLRQAYRLFTLHTDGTFVSEATDWLLMMKFSELNATGGESRFLHLDDWKECKQFAQNPLGSQPMLYKAPGSKNVSEQVERPVFFQGEYGLSVSFIDQFVQPQNSEQATYLYELSQSMENSPGTKTVSLPVGDLVVLNNYFYLHGRAPFEPNEQLHRELMRQRGMFAK